MLGESGSRFPLLLRGRSGTDRGGNREREIARNTACNSAACRSIKTVESQEMMTHKNRSLFVGAALSLAAAIALAPSALARTHTGSTGEPNYPSEAGCWEIYYSSKHNLCSSMKKLYIPADADNSGSRSVTVTASGATSSNNVGCIAYGVNKEITSVWTSGPLQFLSVFGAAQDITLASVYTPSQGSLYVHCEVSPGGFVNQIRFTP